MDILDNSEIGSESNSNFTNRMREYLIETAKWAKFLAIISFICIGFVFIAFAVSAALNYRNQDGMSSFGGDRMGLIISAGYVVFALLGLIPTIYMLKFSTGILKHASTFTIEGIEKALANLKSLFKYCGIVTIVCIVFYLLLIVFLGAGGQKLFMN